MKPDNPPLAQTASSAAALNGDSYTFSARLRAMESPAKSRAAIAIQQMAAQLVAQQVDRGRRGVVVCGPNYGLGISLLTANLAIAIAQVGISVLLVDGNLHDPAIDALIAPSQPSLGLQQVLRSPATSLSDVIHPEILPGLSVVYAGGACDDASELVGGQRCAEVLAECLRYYEYTIVDAPPANRSAEARRLGGCLGYGLIVARRGRTYVDDIATLAGELSEEHCEIIGTIYNQA